MSALSIDRNRIGDELSHADGFLVEVVHDELHSGLAIRGNLDFAAVPRLQAVLDGVLTPAAAAGLRAVVLARRIR